MAAATAASALDDAPPEETVTEGKDEDEDEDELLDVLAVELSLALLALSSLSMFCRLVSTWLRSCWTWVFLSCAVLVALAACWAAVSSEVTWTFFWLVTYCRAAESLSIAVGSDEVTREVHAESPPPPFI